MSVSADVEGQGPAARSRCRGLDAFLTASVIALFVMFAVALAGALWFARHIESELNGRKAARPDGATDSLIAHLPDARHAYKMQNVAYLRAIESKLKSGVMAWEAIPYGRVHTVGSLYSYDATQNALNVKSGSYFLYVQLSLSCTGSCQSGKFTVRINNLLSCTVSLPETGGDDEPVTRTCWRVVTFPDNTNRLLARAEFKDSLEYWKLNMNDTVFGMFLVDGEQAAHQT